MARWERIDLNLPDDFPVASADQLHAHLSDDRPGRTETVEWKEWATALNGCVYRFLGCDEALDVVASLSASDSPPQLERTRQENLLFNFYTHGRSSLEPGHDPVGQTGGTVESALERPPPGTLRQRQVKRLDFGVEAQGVESCQKVSAP